MRNNISLDKPFATLTLTFSLSHCTLTPFVSLSGLLAVVSCRMSGAGVQPQPLSTCPGVTLSLSGP